MQDIRRNSELGHENKINFTLPPMRNSKSVLKLSILNRQSSSLQQSTDGLITEIIQNEILQKLPPIRKFNSSKDFKLTNLSIKKNTKNYNSSKNLSKLLNENTESNFSITKGSLG